jgi:hypothetical protein
MQPTPHKAGQAGAVSDRDLLQWEAGSPVAGDGRGARIVGRIDDLAYSAS